MPANPATENQDNRGENMNKQTETTATGSDSSKSFNREVCLSRLNSLITHKQHLANEIQVKNVGTQAVIPAYKALEQAFQAAISAEIKLLSSLE